MKTYQVTIYSNHTEWKFDGELHREDGPAAEWSDGSKLWYINGKLHREDGPAVEYANDSRYWYINGKELTEEQFNSRHVKELSMEEIERIFGYKVKIVKK